MRRRLFPLLTILSMLLMLCSLWAMKTREIYGSLTPKAWLAGRFGFCAWVHREYLQLQVVHDLTGERRRHGRERQAVTDVDDLRVRDQVMFNAMPALGVARADYAFGARGAGSPTSFRYTIVIVHAGLVALLSTVLPAVWLAREVRRRLVIGKRGFPVAQAGVVVGGGDRGAGC